MASGADTVLEIDAPESVSSELVLGDDRRTSFLSVLGLPVGDARHEVWSPTRKPSNVPSPDHRRGDRLHARVLARPADAHLLAEFVEGVEILELPHGRGAGVERLDPLLVRRVEEAVEQQRQPRGDVTVKVEALADEGA